MRRISLPTPSGPPAWGAAPLRAAEGLQGLAPAPGEGLPKRASRGGEAQPTSAITAMCPLGKRLFVPHLPHAGGAWGVGETRPPPRVYPQRGPRLGDAWGWHPTPGSPGVGLGGAVASL